MDKKISNRKLGIMVAMAMGFSLAFGGTPTDALAATTTVASEGSNYTVNGTTMSYVEMVAAVRAAAKEAGSTVVIGDSATATAVSGESLTLGAGSTLTMKGSTNTATIVGGTTASDLKADGTTVSGSNVNLTSLEVSVNGNKTAKSALTGSVGELKVTGTGNMVFSSTSDNLKVSTLSVASGTALTVSDGATVTAVTTTIGSGATLKSTTGTLSTTNLVVESGAQIASETTVKADTVTVDATDSNVATQLSNLKLSSATTGSTVKVEVVNATADQTTKITEAVKKAAQAGGSTVTVESSVKVTGSGDNYTVGTTTGVTKAGLAAAVAKAYTDGANTVTLDKASTQALQGTAVTIPAGKTMVVADSTGSVSATAKTAATVTLDGLSVSGTDGASFTDVTVDAGSNKVKNSLTGVTADTVTVKSGIVKTSDVSATNLNLDGGTVDTTGTLTAGTVNVNGGTVVSTTSGTTPKIKADTVTVNSGTIDAAITADTVTVSGGTVAAGSTITAKAVTVKGGTVTGATIAADSVAVSDVNLLNGTTLKAATDGGAVTITKSSGTLTDADKAAIAAAVPVGTTVTVKDSNGTSAQVTGTQGAVSPTAPTAATKTAVDNAKALLDGTADSATKYNAIAAAVNSNKQANPFTTKVSSADDVAAASTAVTAYNDALTSSAAAVATITADELAKYNAAYGTNYASVAELQSALQAKMVTASTASSDLRSSIQYAGRTLAAPALAGARSLQQVTNVLTGNAMERTAELRAGTTGLASAVEDQQSAVPENLWVQIKHGSMDVDDSEIYGKSKVKYTNYQLGYDTKLGPNDYLGGFMSTTTGDVTFNGLTASGTVDIKNNFGMGLYGTHVLPKNQYIDAMLQTGTMDSKYSGTTWNTRSFGAMVGYGVNIASSENLTMNPYVRLSYDRITTDDATFSSGNTVSADTQENLALKLGLNLKAASGLYGGLAYSRGLSGDYKAFVNGVAMPSSDNKANVVYLNLGYRGNVGPNTILDLSAEKTFVDYVGWNVAGRVNFLF